MRNTNNLGLNVWDDAGDAYDHDQLADNWDLVDADDHTTHPIPSGGIQDNAVTNGKLATNSVSTAKIQNNAVDATKLADNSVDAAALQSGSVTATKMAADSVGSSAIQADAVGSSELADNAVDTNALQNASVTKAKLASSSVDSSKIENLSITGGDIADSTLTIDKLDPSAFLALALPLGSVIAWYRHSTATPIPTNFALCDGTSWSSITNDLGATTGSIPDLVNSFVLGAGTSGTGTGPNTPPAEKATGGSHTRDLTNHTHTMNDHSHPHSHTVNSHTHNVPAHSHSVNSHSHSISTQADHNHSYTANGDFYELVTGHRKISDSLSGTDLHTVTPSSMGGAPPDGAFVNISNAGSHNHTGSTGAATATTGTQVLTATSGSAPGTSTDSTGSGTLTTNSASSMNSDFRPAFVGLLYIMRVKNG